MIKEAIQYIISLTQAEIIDLHGQKYSSKLISHVKEPFPNEIEISTLTGLVDFVRKVQESNLKYGPKIIHVVSPTKVAIYTESKGDMQRELMISCVPALPTMKLNQYIDTENFIIMLQSTFIPDDESQKVLKCAGNITVEEVRNFTDDGVSQQVTGKVGINKMSDIPVPNPVILKPFRTFGEIDQPASKFIFRLHEGKLGLEAALFEADGGAWKREAMISIKYYLEEELKGTQVVVMA